MRVLVAVSALLWGGFAWLGFDILQRAQPWGLSRSQIVLQAAYLFYGPMLLFLVTCACFAIWKFSRFRRTALAVQIGTVVLVLPYALPYLSVLGSPH